MQGPSTERAKGEGGMNDSAPFIQVMDDKRPRRSQFAMVVVLAPLNGTFEKKSIVIPFSPDILKLGRQTNSKTAATPDNGFFDSRVLSRQHAELWADKDTGKVWIKDCKSSNGTYINRQRLSAENTESEPFELNKNDLIDLGIDIASEENSSLVYKKISARVERISMMPLHVMPINQPVVPTHGKLERSPSLSTVKGRDEDYITSIFGVKTASLESMTLNHTKNSTSGLSLRQDIVGSLEFELAAKQIVTEVRGVRADLAKINSVKSLLQDIKLRQNQGTSVSVAALRAENEWLRSENNTLSAQIADSRKPGVKLRKEKIFRPSDVNNIALLIATNFAMVITGIGVMALFNPPSW